MRNPLKKVADAARLLEAHAETKRVIKEDITEAEARRAVRSISKKAIARRARFILAASRTNDVPCRPKDALKIAQIEYRAQMGGFR